MDHVVPCSGMSIRICIHLRSSAAMVVAILTVALLGLAPSSALANDSCNCQANVTRTVTYCIDGTNYTANVDFCEVNYSPPVLGDCSTTLLQDRKSTLRRICFVGAQPIGYTDAQIMGYLLCHIRLTACNVPNEFGFVVPGPPVRRYCWEIKVPKCTMRANGCIVPCEDCRYSIWAFEWQRAGGNCANTISIRCDGPNCNGQNCTENEGCPAIQCCP